MDSNQTEPMKKELIGLRIFLGSFLTESMKTFGESTVKAMLNRLGQKPGEAVAEQILEKYSKSLQEPFEIPSSAFSSFQSSTTKLFDTEILSQENLKDRIVIKIKNRCPYRQVIKSREELELGGTLCEFTFGYFETALQNLTGLKVNYKFIEEDESKEFCIVNIIFHKKAEDIIEIDNHEN